MNQMKRKWTSILLTLVLVFTTVFSMPANTVSFAADAVVTQSSVDTSVVAPITKWAGSPVVTGSAIYADLNAPNDQLDTSATITHSNAPSPTFVSGTYTNMGCNNNAAGMYYELKFSGAKYGNITLSYSMKSSGTGPKNFKIQYSVDGVTFEDVSPTVFSLAAASTYQNFTVTLPEKANGVSALTVRVVIADGVSANGSTIKAGGTNYFNQISVTGSPLISDSITAIPKASIASGAVRLGEEIALTSATEGADIYYSVNGGTNQLYDSAKKITLSELPATIIAYATKVGKEESLKVKVSYTQSQVAPVQASPNGGAQVLGTKVELSSSTPGAAISYSVDNGTTWVPYDATAKITLSSFPMTIVAKATQTGSKDSEQSTFNFTQRQSAGYNAYFGQIHAHTAYSDGAGTCEDAFNYAKNQAEQIDFLAVTDHSNSFDNADKASIADGSISTEWQEGHALADKYTDSTFVGIYAYEMTWSNGLGHMNTFNSKGFQSRTQTAFSNAGTALQNYYAALKTSPDSISQFNHPGTTFGDFTDFAYYDETIDSLINLIEVGNGEGLVGSDGYFPSYDYYQRALDKGWHVAPTNNQDNHKGKWGDANTTRTVVLADSLTRDNIYDAMRNMRIYATEDNDLNVQYTLNGEIMGTIMKSTPTKADISIKVSDPTDAAVGKVEVIANGGVEVASENVTTSNATLNFSVPADYSYYYVRITQPDKDIAVTAPVWVGEVEAVGIAKMSTSTSLPVKGEALDVKTDLYNNEAKDLNITSIDFNIGDKIIHSVDLAKAALTAVPSMGTKSYTFSYTHDQVGPTTIEATVKGTLNGVEKVYKSKVKLTYADPAMVTNVIVDGSHYNDYVNGYYAGNMGNFTTIAAGKNVKVNVVKTPITAETLANASMLVISAPAKKTGSANGVNYVPTHFEDSFIQLVKEYTQKGGTVVICGMADYQDTADVQSSTELNKLLAAIGATSRINSDQAVDDVLNGGSAYRLYPTVFNTASAFTKGVTADQKYSAYSGCSVLLDEQAVAAGKSEFLVKGFESTYSNDTKQLDTNYVPVTKGNTYFLTRDSLAGGGNAFIASAVFLSDFEIKASLDNANDKQYMNRTIMENILESVKKSVAVSSVKDVRTGKKGNVYSVEGTVTAGTTPGNAFFDTIYVQDATGGINIFPINEGLIEVGQKVKVVGYLDEYLGDLELRVISAEVTDKNKAPLAPTSMTTKAAMDYAANGGTLAKVIGTVTDIIKKNNVVETIMVKDASGVNARVFIDGYVKASAGSDTLDSALKVGDNVSAVGLVSFDPDGARMRVRDRSEILIQGAPSTGGATGTSTQTPTGDKEAKGDTLVETVVKTTTDAKGNTVTETKQMVTDKATGKALETVVAKTMTDQASGTKVSTTVKTNEETHKMEATAVVEPKAVTTVTGKTAQVTLTVAETALLTEASHSAGNAQVKVSIQLPAEEMSKLIADKTVTKVGVVAEIPASISDADHVAVQEIILPKDMLLASKSQKKSIELTVVDETGAVDYAWSMKAADLAKSKREMASVNAALEVKPLTADPSILNLVQLADKKANSGIVVDFAQSGVLPAPAGVRVYVKDQAGVKTGDKLFVYAYNDSAETGTKRKNQDRLDVTTTKTVTVDQDGFVTLSVKEASNYVLLPTQAPSVVTASLLEQVGVPASKAVTEGSKSTLAVAVPVAAQNSKVTFTSSNTSIATVSANGTVYGKKSGTVTITSEVVIDGQKKTWTTKVSVKVKK